MNIFFYCKWSNQKEWLIALRKIFKDGLKRKQIGIIIDGEPLVGPNNRFWPVLTNNDNLVGMVTSAVYSPRLKQNIALAMVDIEYSELGNIFYIYTIYCFFYN